MCSITPKEKALLKEMIELLIYCGYDIMPYIGKPFWYFDYEKVLQFVNVLRQEKREMDGNA